MRVSWMACVFLVGCGSTPSVDAGPSDASSGEPDAGSIQDAGPDGGLEEEDAGSDAGPPPILCETPAEGPRTPVTDRPFHVFRADVAADCEGNLAYAWAESRAELVDDERDADIWLRVLPADGSEPGEPVRLTDDAPGNASNPRVAWSGAQWIVAWTDARNDPEPVTCFATGCAYEVRFAVVDPDGTIARGPEVLASGGGASYATAALSADGETGAALFVYTASTDTDGDGARDHTEAFGVPMAADGTLGEARSISAGAAVRNGARAARGAGAFWISMIAGGTLATVRWPDGAESPDAPSPRGIAGWASRIAAGSDGRLAVWVAEGDGPETRDQTLLVLRPDGIERSRVGLMLGHDGGGPGLAWIGARLYASDRTSSSIDLVALDPADGVTGRGAILESGASGIFLSFDATPAGESFVLEANNSFEQLLVVARP